MSKIDLSDEGLKKLVATTHQQQIGFYDGGWLKTLCTVRDQASEEQKERDAKLAENHGEIVSNDCIGVGKACSRNIANAIRSQG